MKKKKILEFSSENFQFLEVKFSVYLNRRVFVMDCFLCGDWPWNILSFPLIQEGQLSVSGERMINRLEDSAYP